MGTDCGKAASTNAPTKPEINMGDRMAGPIALDQIQSLAVS
jgi:hypothetical protein